jgi:thiopeptide-type bacteriocin biosynthesis protein
VDQIGIPRRYSVADFFVLRTPLLPFSTLAKLSETPSSKVSDPDAASSSQPSVRGLVGELIADPALREAIALASPDLDAQIGKLSKESTDADRLRVQNSLERYLLRAAGRSTPFGLFACTCVGTHGARTSLRIEPPKTGRPFVRVDHGALAGIVAALEADRHVRTRLAYEVNTSLYPCAGQYRYIENHLDANGLVRRELAVVDASEELVTALRSASQPCDFELIVDSLRAIDVAPEDAVQYVHDLIDAQVLVSTLVPPVTGPDALASLTEALQVRLPQHPTTTTLGELRRLVGQLEAVPIGSDTGLYKKAASIVCSIPGGDSHRYVFDVQLPNSSSGLQLGPAVGREIERALGVLELCRNTQPTTDNDLIRQELAEFCTSFQLRFEQRSVPLAVALDDEIGIGFRGAWNQGAADGPAATDEAKRWSPRDSLLARHMSDALRSRQQNIELSDRDLRELGAIAAEAPPSPSRSFVVSARLAARSAAAADDGRFQLYIANLLGTHSGTMLGRFCSADERLDQYARAELQWAAAMTPNIVVAEIVHLSQPRHANVIARPVLQKYEIPYLGRSGAPPENQLRLDDLFVFVEDDRVILWSQRLAREVMPRLTCAHAAFRNDQMPLYRFLYALQVQDAEPSLAWSWGHLNNWPFLPRVSCGRLVLSLARWRLSGRDLSSIKQNPSDAICKVRERLGIPQWVAIEQYDHVLPVDLDSQVGQSALLHLGRAAQELMLVEIFPADGDLVVTDGGATYTHELLIPVRSRTAAGTDTVPRVTKPRSPPPATARAFGPGGEWLFAKLYTGNVTADTLLDAVVRPLAHEAIASGNADRWFFIRYNDPRFHVRLRFHGNADSLNLHVARSLETLCRPWLESGALHSVEFDTYRPEVTRYGGPEAIHLAETAFQVDSEAVLALIHAGEGAASDESRLLLTLVGVDRILRDAGLTLDGRHAFSAALRDSLVAKRGTAPPNVKAIRKVLSTRYREKRAAISRILDGNGGPDDSLRSLAVKVFEARSSRIGPIFERMRVLEANHKLDRPVNDILTSLVHMHVNRAMRNNQQAHEREVYHCLAQHYASERARRDAKSSGIG